MAFMSADILAGEGVCQAATGIPVGHDHQGIGRQDLGGLRHKDDTGEYDDIRLGLPGLVGQVVGIALEVANPVNHLGFDVGVGEDYRVFLLFQAG